jgi:phytoene dehydrogenase-like protein
VESGRGAVPDAQPARAGDLWLAPGGAGDPERGEALAVQDPARGKRAAFSDPRAVQLFDRYATYNGSSPFRTPATMRIIPHVEYAYGGYGLAGGIVALPRALERVARELGVEFRLGSRVDRIVVAEGRCRGVEAGGEHFPVRMRW